MLKSDGRPPINLATRFDRPASAGRVRHSEENVRAPVTAVILSNARTGRPIEDVYSPTQKHHLLETDNRQHDGPVTLVAFSPSNLVYPAE